MKTLDADQLADLVREYRSDGFAYVRQMFSAQELAPLSGSLVEGASPGGFSVTDSAGGAQELSVWLELGDDLIGVLPRLEPIVALASAVVAEDVYHWHSKISWKRPSTKSLWDWHQDYGFWVDDGVHRPDMCTIAIALGSVHRGNGCMQLLRGSHNLGKLDVVEVGKSQGVDPALIDGVIETHPIEYCELEAGDVVVFHSNTLHGSGPNESDHPRTMLMSSYNARSNVPSSPRHPAYRPDELAVVPASAVRNGWTSIFGSTPFVDPERDGMTQGYSTTSHSAGR